MEAIAVVDIGISRETFWDLEPAQWQAYLDRRELFDFKRDKPLAVLTASVLNAFRDTDETPDPYQIKDIIHVPAEVASVAAAAKDDSPWAACRECGIPKWQGHHPSCETGRTYFNGPRQAGRVKTQKQKLEELRPMMTHGTRWRGKTN